MAVQNTIIMEKTEDYSYGTSELNLSPSSVNIPISNERQMFSCNLFPNVPTPISVICSLKKYRPIRELGSGSFSYVWEVEELSGKDAGRVSALKALRNLQHRRSAGLSLVDEADLQNQIYHHTSEQFGVGLVPKIYGCEQHWNHNGYILMESLAIPEDSSAISYKQWLNNVRNIARVHQVLHNDLERHNGDIKKKNVLDNGRVIDFGGCGQRSQYTSSHRPGSVLCTLGYASPEQLRLTDSDDSRLTDVFSLGIVAYVLASNKLPFNFSDISSYRKSLEQWEFKELSDLVGSFSSDASDLVQKMMGFKPEERPLMEDVVGALDKLLLEEANKSENINK